MPLCPEIKYVKECSEMNDLGIGDHSGEAFPIRPLLPHPSPAYTLGACHLLRDAIAHEYRFVVGYLQGLQGFTFPPEP